MNEINLTIHQIELMRIAIGLETRKIKRNVKFIANRNHYYLDAPDTDWSNLCDKGLATWYYGDNYTDFVYILTCDGISALERIFGIKIIMED